MRFGQMKKKSKVAKHAKSERNSGGPVPPYKGLETAQGRFGSLQGGPRTGKEACKACGTCLDALSDVKGAIKMRFGQIGDDQKYLKQ